MDPATGGPPAVVGAVTAALRQAGVDAQIACYSGWPDDGGPERVTKFMHSLPEGAAVPIHDLGPLSKPEVATARHSRKYLAQILRSVQPHLLHLHGVWDPMLRAAFLAAQPLAIPHVISTHGTFEKTAIARKPFRKYLMWHLGWGKMIQTAKAIHDYRSRPIEVLGKPVTPKLWEIPNGIELPTETDTNAAWTALLSKHPALDGKRIVLYLGRIAPEKGLDLLAEALGHAKAAGTWPADALLLLAGPDYGVAAQLEALHLPELLLPGPLYGPEKSAAFAHASLFVLPSRGEGFSMSILEAMANRLPVIMTNTCNFPQAATAGAALEVTLGDVPALSAALTSLLANPAKAAEMGQTARRLVESDYTWPHIVTRYIAMYRSATTP